MYVSLKVSGEIPITYDLLLVSSLWTHTCQGRLIDIAADRLIYWNVSYESNTKVLNFELIWLTNSVSRFLVGDEAFSLVNLRKLAIKSNSSYIKPALLYYFPLDGKLVNRFSINSNPPLSPCVRLSTGTHNIFVMVFPRNSPGLFQVSLRCREALREQSVTRDTKSFLRQKKNLKINYSFQRNYSAKNLST